MPGTLHRRPRPAATILLAGGHVIDPGEGCRFLTRCPIAIEICRHQVPAWRTVGDSQVACHLA